MTGLLFRAAIWFGFYVLLVSFPLVTAAVFHPAAGRSFAVDFGVGCGFVGLAIMVFQFALISRVKSDALTLSVSPCFVIRLQM